MTPRPLDERLSDARSVFDEKTKGGGGMEAVVRGFFLSVVFPQLRKAAKANPQATEDAIVEMVRILVNVLGVRQDQLFPPLLDGPSPAASLVLPSAKEP